MKKILPVIIISQFFCTSLWFAGNAIIPDLIESHHLSMNFLAPLTSAVQFGFITGTLVFAIFTIADRFSPSVVFFASSVFAGLFNLGLNVQSLSSPALLLLRFITGFFLAGIYPVGMKITSDYFQKGLGISLSYLVGALVLGTSFPHLLKSVTMNFPWESVIYATSALSFVGGILMLALVPDGPYRKPAQKLNLSSFLTGFKNKNLRSAAFGYFGHMWELYTFWVFVPVMLTTYSNFYREKTLNVSLLSFLIIASGSLACILGGMLAKLYGVKNVATVSLFLSCLCCLLSPLFLMNHSTSALLIFLFIWGLTVIADSPLFSTLVAQNAPEESRGSSLTIVNCIGFSITIVSIQFINMVYTLISARYIFMLLAAGPIFGLIALLRNKTPSSLNKGNLKMFSTIL